MSNGLGKLHEGIVSLHDGSTRLSDETADMPNTVQTKIDEMLSQYSSKDFEPVSFVSDRNKNTSFVQFVFKTAQIEKQEQAKDASTEAKPLSFWDRFIALFT
jgi:X-X-X-Leu-X-X-Gly heptad repeat protein